MIEAGLDRRAQLLEVAAELFAERGFAAVGIDDIGAGVGLTGPALYGYFPNKAEILADIVSDSIERLKQAAAYASEMTGFDAPVGHVIRQAVEVALDRPARLATYLRERQRVLDDSGTTVANAESAMRQAWIEVLRTLHPELSDEELRMRQAAAIGALSAGAYEGTPSNRRTPMLMRAVIAVVLSPNSPSHGPPVNHAWRPAPSRRDHIMTTALRLFRERGYDGVGVDEIAAKASLSGATLYHYFNSKAEILVDAYDRVAERVMASAAESLENATSASDALTRLARSYAWAIAHNVDLIVVTSREDSALPAAERDRLARRRRTLFEAWIGVLSEVRPELSAVEARLLIRMVFALLRHAAMAAPRDRDSSGEAANLAVALCMS